MKRAAFLTVSAAVFLSVCCCVSGKRLCESHFIDFELGLARRDKRIDYT